MNESKKSKFINNGTVLTLLILSILLVIGFSFLSIYLKNKNLEINTQINSLKVTSHEQLEEISNLKKLLLKRDIELDKLKRHLEGIKDKDDLLGRDIFVYIDKNYVSIPSSVSRDISKNIVSLSKKYEVSPELIIGVIQVESSFNPMAVSPKKARGLMQVMPEWVSKLDSVSDVTDLHDIDVNIEAGIQVLLIHISESGGSLSKGLYHYVGKSSSYVDKVYRAMGQFSAFRSTIDDEKLDGENETGKEKKVESEQRAAEHS